MSETILSMINPKTGKLTDLIWKPYYDRERYARKVHPLAEVRGTSFYSYLKSYVIVLGMARANHTIPIPTLKKHRQLEAKFFPDIAVAI